MKVWLETVPFLLKHLNIQYVSLVCHSAGTLYLLNTLYYLRDILHPQHPYVGTIGKYRLRRVHHCRTDCASSVGPYRALEGSLVEFGV
jgi:hypothetical protein